MEALMILPQQWPNITNIMTGKWRAWSVIGWNVVYFLIVWLLENCSRWLTLMIISQQIWGPYLSILTSAFFVNLFVVLCLSHVFRKPQSPWFQSGEGKPTQDPEKDLHLFKSLYLVLSSKMYLSILLLNPFWDSPGKRLLAASCMAFS